MRVRTLAFALFSLVAAAPAFAADSYTMDPNHTRIELGWNHFGFSNMSANIDKFSSELNVDTDDWSKSSVNVSMPLASIDSGVDDLDEHMNSPDFFDSAKFADATFKSTKVEKVGDGKLKVTGDFSVHGVTKEVVLDVTVNKIGKHPASGKDAIGFDATATIKRSDFTVDKYVPNVSDDIWIKISFEANKAKAAG